MKTDNVEKLLLLEQSGELGPLGRWRLNRALARQPDLKAFREDLGRIADLSRSSGPADAPDPCVLGAIRQSAAGRAQEGFGWAAASWLRPAIACAAILLAVGGIALVNQYHPGPGARIASHAQQRGPGWEEDLDAQLSSIQSLLAANFDASGESIPSDPNAIAMELLGMEGLQQ